MNGDRKSEFWVYSMSLSWEHSVMVNHFYYQFFLFFENYIEYIEKQVIILNKALKTVVGYNSEKLLLSRIDDF